MILIISEVVSHLQRIAVALECEGAKKGMSWFPTSKNLEAEIISILFLSK